MISNIANNINALIAAILAIIKYINSEMVARYADNFILRFILAGILKYQGEIVIFCLTFIFLYTLIIKIYNPLEHEKRKTISNALELMNSTLFAGNQDLHRITLFIQIHYPTAILRHIGSFFYHIPYRKASLYCKFLPMGRYLAVYERCGCQVKKSSTMLRVELNDPQKCDGVASYLLYRKVAFEAIELPNITDITNDEFIKAKTLADIKKSRRKDVEEYMKQGFISDFNTLRKMHRRARHFYGTIIQKNKTIWGVLLADSTSDTNPFNATAKKQFDSFSEIISGIINMEVR